MRSSATSIKEYLAGLPADRRAAVEAVRKTILDHLPPGYEEAFAWGMIGYHIPLAVYPDTYNKQPFLYAAVASQKSHLAVYLTNVYAIPALQRELAAGFAAAGKRLDMGKSCIRFKKLEDLPLDVIGRAVAATPVQEMIAHAEQYHPKARAAARKKAAPAKKKPAARKPRVKARA